MLIKAIIDLTAVVAFILRVVRIYVQMAWADIIIQTGVMSALTEGVATTPMKAIFNPMGEADFMRLTKEVIGQKRGADGTISKNLAIALKRGGKVM
jgi:hypothetical protein